MYNTVGWIVVSILVFYTINKFEKELENTIRNLEDKVSDLKYRVNALENKNRDDDDYTDENI
ncbi:MAG: hypothetical protein COU31_03235 [Candidatus Magasanikbacteria bacterium CG10_big_fil_rev_8_21_14_0_10_40_10]|uniref:Uncharacterized protein n=1 Tax=Candidatus Magasanikbacteria bacterium CG10_big_fil_rev_8_21_14_0_10_40_10 TaxID=1974648 RepID=A0A2M6W3K3_9BACT|nr:MAG: hypothetical protein COU31_03235 [Candidatus Magasanikbacteria bacterium CG10_big_fil_rev_8_21_14_0_10_40_10]